jgi:hypothetical protein
MGQFLLPLGGPLAGAAAAIVTIAAANALAGSGINGVFNLGVANTVDAQTALSGNAGTNPQLRVENASTSSPASGVLGKMTSTSAAADSAGVRGVTASTSPSAAAVVGKNTGGGPAFLADVEPGAPPLAVDSSGLVANLNADQVDGRHAGELKPNEVIVVASPWNLRSLSSGATIAVAQGPMATVKATSIGFKTIALPFDISPRFLYSPPGGGLTVANVEVCYSVSTTAAAITATALKQGLLGANSTVVSQSASHKDTSPTCYTVFAAPNTGFIGSAYLQLQVSFTAIGQSLTLYSSQIVYDNT